MQLLSPIYLFGFLAISAPILIHLIRRRQVTVIPWAANRFLLSVTKKLQKRKRIDDLILLLLRCFLFVLLALLFARPFFTQEKNVMVAESGTLVVLVDASASMGASNGVNARFDEARNQVEAALEGLSDSTAVALILFADQAYPVVSPPTMEHAVILQELERQSPRPERSNVGAGLSAALEVLASRGGGSVLLVSDGQSVAWQEKVELKRLLLLAEERSVAVKLVNVAEAAEVSNLGIIDFELANSRPITDQAVHLRLVVKNGGNTTSSESRVVMEQVAGFPIMEARVPSLPAGEATTVQMQMTFSEPGWHCLTASISGDNLAADDHRSVGLLVSDGLRVGIVEGPQNSELNVSPGFFLATAAVPVSGAKARRFPVQVSMLQPSALTTDAMQGYRVIALAGVEDLDRSQVDALIKFVENGGGLWLLPPSAGSGVEQFLKNPILGELLPTLMLDAVRREVGEFPASAPYDHPITAYWNETKASSLAGFHVEHMLSIQQSTGANTVLRLAGGEALFVAEQRGAGRVFLSALPLDGSWSNLPFSPQFLPLVQRSLAWLSSSVDAPNSIASGDEWRVRVPAINVGRPFYSHTPLTAGAAKTAGQVEFVDGQAIVTYSDTRSLGRYALHLDADEAPVGRFGVNLDPVESDLRKISEADLIELSTVALQSVLNADESQGAFGRLTTRLPDLWVIVVFLILITGAVELYLAQRFSRSL